MFEHFPKRWFQDIDGEYRLMTNLCRKFNIPENIKNEGVLYLTYEIQDGDTARSLCDKLYDDHRLFLFIYMVNNITDPVNQWPKSNYALVKWLNEKYGMDNIYDIHHYENLSGDIVDIKALKFAHNMTSLSDSDVVTLFNLQAISHYDFHIRENDKLRKIKMIDPDYIGNFKKALEEVFDEY